MNINFPDREPDEVEGISVTTQGRRDPGLLAIDERQDTWGNPYYWLAFERRRSTTQEGTDLWAVYSGRISVTPLCLDLTHQAMRERLARGAGDVGWVSASARNPTRGGAWDCRVTGFALAQPTPPAASTLPVPRSAKSRSRQDFAAKPSQSRVNRQRRGKRGNALRLQGPASTTRDPRFVNGLLTTSPLMIRGSTRCAQ